MVSNLNAKNKEFQALLDRWLEYMRDKDTPTELHDRVLQYLRYINASRIANTVRPRRLAPVDNKIRKGFCPKSWADFQASNWDSQSKR